MHYLLVIYITKIDTTYICTEPNEKGLPVETSEAALTCCMNYVHQGPAVRITNRLPPEYTDTPSTHDDRL